MTLDDRSRAWARGLTTAALVQSLERIRESLEDRGADNHQVATLAEAAKRLEDPTG